MERGRREGKEEDMRGKSKERAQRREHVEREGQWKEKEVETEGGIGKQEREGRKKDSTRGKMKGRKERGT